MYLINHVTLQDQPIEGSFEFMGGSSLQYAITLTSFVTIRIVIVDT